jgi:hypothetical protein
MKTHTPLGHTHAEWDALLSETARFTGSFVGGRITARASASPGRVSVPANSIGAALARAKAEPDPHRRALAYAEASRLITRKRN